MAPTASPEPPETLEILETPQTPETPETAESPQTPRRWWRFTAILTSATGAILVIGLLLVACLNLPRVLVPEKTKEPDLQSGALRAARAKATARIDKVLAELPAASATRIFDAKADECSASPGRSWFRYEERHFYDCAVRRTRLLGVTPDEVRSTVRDIGSQLAGTGWQPQGDASVGKLLHLADLNVANSGDPGESRTARYSHDGDHLELHFGPASGDYPSRAIEEQEVDGLAPYWTEHEYTTEAALTAAAKRAGGIILVVTVQRAWYKNWTSTVGE